MELGFEQAKDCDSLKAAPNPTPRLWDSAKMTFMHACLLDLTVIVDSQLTIGFDGPSDVD